MRHTESRPGGLDSVGRGGVMSHSFSAQLMIDHSPGLPISLPEEKLFCAFLSLIIFFSGKESCTVMNGNLSTVA